MEIHLDLKRLLGDKSINLLTWEIIEARGVAVGDLALLFDTALDMTGSAIECKALGELWMTPEEDGGIDETSFNVGMTYTMLSKFFIREAREIMLFLYHRGFIFPDGFIGDAPDDTQWT